MMRFVLAAALGFSALAVSQMTVTADEGTVEEIQTRATYLLLYDGRRVVLRKDRAVALTSLGDR